MSEVQPTNHGLKTAAVGVTTAVATQGILLLLNRLGYANIGRWAYAISAGTGALAAAGYHWSSKPDPKTTAAASTALATPQTQVEKPQPRPNSSPAPLHQIVDQLSRSGLNQAQVNEILSSGNAQTSLKAIHMETMLLTTGGLRAEDEPKLQAMINWACENGVVDTPYGEQNTPLLERLPAHLVAYGVGQGADPFAPTSTGGYVIDRAGRDEEMLTHVFTSQPEEKVLDWFAHMPVLENPDGDAATQDEINTRYGPLLKSALIADRPVLVEHFTQWPQESRPLVECGNPSRDYPWQFAAAILCSQQVVDSQGDAMPQRIQLLDLGQVVHPFYLVVETASNEGLTDKVKAMLRNLYATVDQESYNLAVQLAPEGAIKEFLESLRPE